MENIKEFFESDIFWGLLFSSIVALMGFFVKWIKNKIKDYEEDKKTNRQKSAITHQLLCIKQDLIIEMTKKKPNQEKIKELQEEIENLHKELNIIQ